MIHIHTSTSSKSHRGGSTKGDMTSELELPLALYLIKSKNLASDSSIQVTCDKLLRNLQGGFLQPDPSPSSASTCYSTSPPSSSSSDAPNMSVSTVETCPPSPGYNTVKPAQQHGHARRYITEFRLTHDPPSRVNKITDFNKLLEVLKYLNSDLNTSINLSMITQVNAILVESVSMCSASFYGDNSTTVKYTSAKLDFAIINAFIAETNSEILRFKYNHMLSLHRTIVSSFKETLPLRYSSRFFQDGEWYFYFLETIFKIIVWKLKSENPSALQLGSETVVVGKWARFKYSSTWDTYCIPKTALYRILSQIPPATLNVLIKCFIRLIVDGLAILDDACQEATTIKGKLLGLLAAYGDKELIGFYQSLSM